MNIKVLIIGGNKSEKNKFSKVYPDSKYELYFLTLGDKHVDNRSIMIDFNLIEDLKYVVGVFFKFFNEIWLDVGVSYFTEWSKNHVNLIMKMIAENGHFYYTLHYVILKYYNRQIEYDWGKPATSDQLFNGKFEFMLNIEDIHNDDLKNYLHFRAERCIEYVKKNNLDRFFEVVGERVNFIFGNNFKGEFINVFKYSPQYKLL